MINIIFIVYISQLKSADDEGVRPSSDQHHLKWIRRGSTFPLIILLKVETEAVGMKVKDKINSLDL